MQGMIDLLAQRVNLRDAPTPIGYSMHTSFSYPPKRATRIPKCPKIVQPACPPTRKNIKIEKNHIFKSYVHRVAPIGGIASGETWGN